MSEKLAVFLSSTSQMEAERNALTSKLPNCYELYRYEEDRARTTSPKARCLQMIQQSDAFVGILGTKYGTSFTVDGEQKSIVEWEFDMAIGSRHLEILTFIKNLTPGEVPEPRQQVLITRVSDFGSGLWCKRFSTPSEFAEFVHAALQQMLIARWNELNIKMGKLRSKAARVLLTIASVSVLTLVIIASPPLGHLFSTRSMVGFSAVITVVVLLCAVMTLRELRPTNGKPG